MVEKDGVKVIPESEVGEVYKTLDDIPPLVFLDRYCTVAPDKELRKWLRVMHTYYPDDLRFLFRKGQHYINYGLQSRYTFKRWLNLLDVNLKKEGD